MKLGPLKRNPKPTLAYLTSIFCDAPTAFTVKLCEIIFKSSAGPNFPISDPRIKKRKENRKNERERKDYAHFFSFFGGTDFAGPLNRSSIILDSGCSVHLLNSKSLFRVLEEEDGSESIKTGKPGAGLKILGKGIALIKLGQVNLELKDAYYVPEATINLFSFGKLPNLCR